MSTSKSNRSKNAFEFETLSQKEASARRSQKGTRRSKYSPIGEKFQTLGSDEVLAFKASKNEVQGVRNYMRRNFSGEHQVNSRRLDGDQFEVHVSKVGPAVGQ